MMFKKEKDLEQLKQALQKKQKAAKRQNIHWND